MNEKWTGWLKQIRTGEKIPKKNQILLLFLAGVLLLVIVAPVSGGTDRESGKTGTETEDDVEADRDAYEQYLEDRTARVLEKVEGVGKTTVMITLKSSGQKIIEKDSRSDAQNSDEEDSSGGTRATRETSSEETSIYEQESDGTQTPYVSMETAPEIEGVVVIAEGGGNAVVVRNITEAVQALFGVDAHKIKVMKRADT